MTATCASTARSTPSGATPGVHPGIVVVVVEEVLLADEPPPLASTFGAAVVVAFAVAWTGYPPAFVHRLDSPSRPGSGPASRRSGAAASPRRRPRLDRRVTGAPPQA